MNQSVHAVDLLQWLLGPVESLCAYTEILTHDIETEDLATAALRFESGALGVVQGTTCNHRDFPLKVELRGTEGSATFEGTRLTGWYPIRDEELLSEEELVLFPESEDEPLGPAHGRQLRCIFEALREGREPPVPGEEARKAVEIILGIYQAASSGERVSLRPMPGR
jgi:predicted dehydrogenase